MSVFRDVVLTVGGTDYTVTPSNRLLRSIEGKGRRDDPDFNLVGVFVRLSSGNGAVNEAAFVLAEMVNASGGKITEDDALAHMLSIDDPKDFRAFVDLFCSCVMPELKEKKPAAPTETA